MNRLIDPRLWIIVSIGVAALGFIFADCGEDWRRTGLWCPYGDGLQWIGVPYKWVFAAAICSILLATYLLWDEKRRKNSN